MDKQKIIDNNKLIRAKMAIKYAMKVFGCKSIKELEETCSYIIDIINYLKDYDNN